MIAQFGAHHHILNIDLVAVASGAAAGDDTVGLELINHTLGTEGGVHLADATLLYTHITVVEELL